MYVLLYATTWFLNVLYILYALSFRFRFQCWFWKHWFSFHLWAFINRIYTRGTNALLHIGLCAPRWKWNLPSVDVVRYSFYYYCCYFCCRLNSLLLAIYKHTCECNLINVEQHTDWNGLWEMLFGLWNCRQKCWCIGSEWYLINVTRRINNIAHRPIHVDHISLVHNEDTLVICCDSNT